MENVLNYPCAGCHDYTCMQEHGWCYMDDHDLYQKLLEGLAEMLRRRTNIQTPYPSPYAAGMMETEPHYNYPTAYPTMMYPPTFNAGRSFAAKDMDALVARMENSYITPPAHSTDIWAADSSASLAAQQDLPSSYDASAPWCEGYVGAPQDADRGDEDTRHTGQHANIVETSFLPPAPDAVPSISVIEHLEQGTYPPKQPVKGTPAGPVYFNGSEGQGASLGSLDTVVNGNQPAFDTAASIGEKASIRFELPQFPRHAIQVRVRHGDKKGRDGRPVTLREMGDTVFDELAKLMDHAKKSGDPLQHRGSVVDIERVVLLRVDHISKGSIQPILGIRNNG